MLGMKTIRKIFADPVRSEPDLNLDQSRRDRLIRMVKRSPHVIESPVEPGTDPVRSAAAAEFVTTAIRLLKQPEFRIDRASMSMLDTYLDASKTIPQAIARSRNHMASWLGEIARRSHGLAWDGDILTDGRVLFDPAVAVAARLSSSRAALGSALEHALTISTIRSSA